MSNVYYLQPDSLPTNDVTKCLSVLTAQARRRRVTGIAFVAYIEGHGFIANAAGDAYDDPTNTLGMLRALERKLDMKVTGGTL